MYRNSKKSSNEMAYRSVEQRDLVIDEAARTVELSFASDFAVERWDWIEVLDMQGMDMGRIGSGRAALLVEHNRTDHVGVVESVTVGSDQTARAKVRFSKSARGQEIFQDVVDGIRSLVSVGYRIHEVELASSADGVSTYRVKRWEPFEISLVSIPADPTVGVGRSADLAPSVVTPAAADPLSEPVAAATRSVPASPKSQESTMDEIQKAILAANQRAADILTLGAKHNAADAAREFVAAGKTVDEFRQHILDQKPATAVQTSVSGISDTEARSFSFLKLIQARTSGDWSKAGFERAACAAAASNLGRSAKGDFIPMEVLASRASQHVAGTASAGGNLIATDLRTENFIEALQARMMAQAMGATVLTGLVGKVAIPKETGLMGVTWVAEDGNAVFTASSFGQVPLAPKTVLAKTSISRSLMSQSSLDVENLVRSRLQKAIALAIDRAALIGGGANEPVGLLGGALGAGRKVVIGAGYSWEEIVAMETLVAVADADMGNLGYLTNASVRGALKTTEKAVGTAQFIWQNGAAGMGELNGYKAGVTSQLSGVQNIFGNFADLIIGLWTGTDLVVDTITDDSGAHIVKVFQDADVALARAESFSFGATA